MKTKVTLLGIFVAALSSFAQSDWERAGGSMGGIAPTHNFSRGDVRSTPEDGIYLRVVNGKIVDFHKAGDSINGSIIAETDGLIVLNRDAGEVALTNYTGNVTEGKKIYALAILNGKYKWGDIPLEIWDCGKAYVPPPPTAEQIKAAQEAAKIATLREKQKQFLAQSNAVVWLQSQATNGDASAQYSLGEHYLNGQGCETNREQAIYWLTQAANQGDMKASNRLSKLKSP